MTEVCYIGRAREAWSGKAPEWVLILARACRRSSQNRVASQLGVNAGYISNALHRKNPEYHRVVEDAVRAKLMRETVTCPVLGSETTLAACRTLRRGVEAGGRSPIQKQARGVCPSCQHNIKGIQA